MGMGWEGLQEIQVLIFLKIDYYNIIYKVNRCKKKKIIARIYTFLSFIIFLIIALLINFCFKFYFH